ncbi:general secretion pathway protein GspB [Roseateles sp. BYS87W]|uniref:General secretion pathway protein GspB n=1 Tax=Pelomonas baiyunensis TaxID=3299026 RepID=A0ABW7H0W3_9BURK
MSYILEALRRAEAERERGQVPGLHTPVAAAPAPAASGATARRWAPWLGGAALCLAGAALGAWWTWGGRAQPAALPATAEPARVTAAPVNAAPETATPRGIAPETPPVPAVATAPAPLAVAAAPAPVATAPAPMAAPAPAAAAAAEPPTPRSARPAPRPAEAAAPAPAARLPVPAELPEALRRELPKLAVGGSVYSDDPAARLVVLNGEVLHEGDRIGADLQLERIAPRELVLRFKGQRLRLPM